MQQYQKKLETFLGVKATPSDFELALFEKTRRYVRLVSWIPGLRMVAVGNSLAMYATHSESDIDLFIITAPRRMWLVRICMTLIFQILGVRMHGEKHAGRFCLSFFATEHGLDFRDFALENDIYLYHWIYSLKPIYDAGGMYDRFLEINDWVEVDDRQYGENRRFLLKYPETRDQGPGARGWWDRWLDHIDRTLERVFLPRTIAKQKKLGFPYGIRVTSDLLKFHSEDRRAEIRETIFRMRK